MAEVARQIENAPLGVPEYHANPPDHVCPVCRAQLMVERHAQRCSERSRIFRMLDPRLHAAEDALQRATTKAFGLWALGGFRP